MKKNASSLPRFSVGIICHNEEGNIQYLLESLRRQTCWERIADVAVISSGSTDRTNSIVESFAAKNKKVRLYKEKKRNGKARAVNIFLEKAERNLLILMSGDLILEKNTLEYMTKPFSRKDVGIVGARPIPVNNNKSFIGFAVHLLWDLHHQVSLRNPKMGEAIAFRKIFKQIHELSVVDEVNIESLIKGQGFRAVYAPKAIVHNKGPETISDFVKVRRRIFAGHIATKKEYSYSVSTLNNSLVFFLAIKNMKLSPRYGVYLLGTILLEAYSRLAGFVDYRFHKNKHASWEIALTTKKLK